MGKEKVIEGKNAEKFTIKKLPSVLAGAGKVWNDHNPWRLGAVVAYYALLSLPGLLIVTVTAVGAIWGPKLVEGEITGQIEEVVGSDVAESVQSIIDSAQLGEQSVLMTIVGIAILLFGATGVFYHLQLSLNALWDIRQEPESNILKLLIDRAVSFGFVLVIGFLLLISFIVSALLSAFGDFLATIWEPAYVVAAQVIDFVISTGVITVLFALMFRFLPDARVRWLTIWRGALLTALLFNLGVFVLGYYFGKASPGSMYGAAGSVVALLLWISYACLIFFYGAALVRYYEERFGAGINPRNNAVQVTYEPRVVKKGKKDEE